MPFKSNSHTSGPWNFSGDLLLQDKGNRLHIGSFVEGVGLRNAAAANKKLIEASPDMLAALIVARDAFEDLIGGAPPEVYAAIKLALGEQGLIKGESK